MSGFKHITVEKVRMCAVNGKSPKEKVSMRKYCSVDKLDSVLRNAMIPM